MHIPVTRQVDVQNGVAYVYCSDGRVVSLKTADWTIQQVWQL